MTRKFKENVSLAAYSNYNIGGPARYFFEAKSEDDVRWAIGEAKKMKAPVFILAGGTNVLISDEGWSGLILRPCIMGLKAKGTTIEAGAGVLMGDLLKFAQKNSLTGLEWAGGLPGTVGGAIRGNAGCFGGEIKDAVKTVKVLDVKTMKTKTCAAKECAFKYRESIFKKKNGAEIILSTTFSLAKGDKKEIARATDEKIAHRAKNHPLEHPNLGSTFKNVPLWDIHKKGSIRYKKALVKSRIEYRGSTFSIKKDPFPVISAAKLISESGLRGVSYGGAMISPKHPNFIVNVLGAGSPHIKGLINLAKSSVFRKFGVRLEEEVGILDPIREL